MIPTETDRFLAEIRGAAEGGAQIMPYDVLRILRIVEYQGREILRLRVSEPQPVSGPRSLNAELVALGVPRVTVALLSADERRALIRAALREASAADCESESVRRTEAASPDDLPSLSPPSPVPPASAGSAPDLSDAAGSGGGSESQLCPDCRGLGKSGPWPATCLTCAGEGRIGGGR